jgi:hypothetical protein
MVFCRQGVGLNGTRDIRIEMKHLSKLRCHFGSQLSCSHFTHYTIILKQVLSNQFLPRPNTPFFLTLYFISSLRHLRQLWILNRTIIHRTTIRTIPLIKPRIRHARLRIHDMIVRSSRHAQSGEMYVRSALHTWHPDVGLRIPGYAACEHMCNAAVDPDAHVTGVGV